VVILINVDAYMAHRFPTTLIIVVESTLVFATYSILGNPVKFLTNIA
jgi:hypothetical protein